MKSISDEDLSKIQHDLNEVIYYLRTIEISVEKTEVHGKINVLVEGAISKVQAVTEKLSIQKA